MKEPVKKIRILVDAHIFDHSFQGTFTYIKGLYNSLVLYNDLEIFICANDIDNLKKHFTHDKFNFIHLKTKSKFLRLSFEFPSIISKYKIDFAHFQYIVPVFKNCKFINTIHDLLFLDYPQLFPWSYRVVKGNLFKYSSKKSEIILSVSNYSKAQLVKHFKIESDNIHVTPNAVNSLTKSELDIKEKYKLDKYILYVSRFEPRKNQLGLLKSYLKLELYKQGYDLVFIGSYKEKIEYDYFNLIVNRIPSNFKTNVKFFSNVDSTELSSFYQNASLFVFPSIAEGFGIPPLEAAINNCKVVCSNATAMKDFDFFKYMFDPYDNSSLIKSIQDALEDNEYPFEAIASDIVSRYSWKNIAREFHEVLIKQKENII